MVFYDLGYIEFVAAHGIFYSSCQAIKVKVLPEELAFLEHRDTFHARVTAIVDMSERLLDLLLRFLQQNGGHLSKRALDKEFALLTPAEVETIEAIYGDLFI